MRTKVLSTQRTIIPYDYDYNGKSGFESWKQYITEEVSRTQSEYNVHLLEIYKFLAKENMKSLKKTIRKDDWVKADRFVYVALLIITIILHYLFS